MDIETLKETVKGVESLDLHQISRRMRVLQFALAATPEVERKVRFDLELEIDLLADEWNIRSYGKDEWRRHLKDSDLKSRREFLIQKCDVNSL